MRIEKLVGDRPVSAGAFPIEAPGSALRENKNAVNSPMKNPTPRAVQTVIAPRPESELLLQVREKLDISGPNLEFLKQIGGHYQNIHTC